MKVTIHQPGYLPWIPFVEKALQSDTFVFLDDVQFEKNSEQNRNRIKTPQGETWLTVPVQRDLHTLIPDITIPEAQRTWNIKHVKTIQMNYARAPFYREVSPPLFETLEQNWERLLDLNLAIDRLFFSLAGFSGSIVRSSELSAEGVKSDRILSICRALGAKTYYSGRAGFDYLDLDKFRDCGIEVLFQNYGHSPYPQQHQKAGFIPRLSTLDLFMNAGTGKAAQKVIIASAGWLTAAQTKDQPA